MGSGTDSKNMRTVIMRIVLPALLFCCMADKAQNAIGRAPEVYRKPGIQFGYANMGQHRIEAGVNYYWTLVQSTRKKSTEFHTVGPSAGLNLLFLNGRSVTGMQAGLNYHLYHVVCPRIAIHYENYFNGDQRIGADLGASFAGFFIYAGYYPAIGNRRSEGVSAFRGGLRFVFNLVLIDSSPPQ